MKRCHGKSIEADYRICFGAPRLVKHGISVETILWSLFAEGWEQTAKAYGLKRRHILVVAEYLEKLIQRDGECDLADAFWEGRRSK